MEAPPQAAEEPPHRGGAVHRVSRHKREGGGFQPLTPSPHKNAQISGCGQAAGANWVPRPVNAKKAQEEAKGG